MFCFLLHAVRFIYLKDNKKSAVSEFALFCCCQVLVLHTCIRFDYCICLHTWCFVVFFSWICKEYFAVCSMHEVVFNACMRLISECGCAAYQWQCCWYVWVCGWVRLDVTFLFHLYFACHFIHESVFFFFYASQLKDFMLCFCWGMFATSFLWRG